jgi:multiple sugar transport system permease protein
MPRALRALPTHLLLVLGGLVFLLPFYWMVSTSLKGADDLFRSPPSWWPAVPRFANYPDAWNAVPFLRYFANTFLGAGLIVAGVVVTSALAAFAFSFLKFRGRERLFDAFLATMMVPEPVYLVSSYILLYNLPGGGRDGWIDDYSALVVPWMAHVFSIFLLRQHFLTFRAISWTRRSSTVRTAALPVHDRAPALANRADGRVCSRSKPGTASCGRR